MNCLPASSACPFDALAGAVHDPLVGFRVRLADRLDLRLVAFPRRFFASRRAARRQAARRQSQRMSPAFSSSPRHTRLEAGASHRLRTWTDSRLLTRTPMGSASPTRCMATAPRPRLRAGIRLPRRAHLGGAGDRPLPAPAGLLLAADPLRQARPGALRPPGRPTDAGGVDGRPAGGDGRGGLRAGGDLRHLRGRADVDALRGDLSRPGLLADPLRDLRADDRGARTIPRGCPSDALDGWDEMVRRGLGRPGRRATSGRRAWPATPSSNVGGGACCARARARPARSR